MANEPLYIFIDESGDFNFSATGTKYYIISTLITHVPSESCDALNIIRHEILAGKQLNELGVEYLESKLCHGFHAAEDRQPVRDEVFTIIENMKYFKVHSIVVQKNKANPSIRNPHDFYSKITGYLLDYVFKTYQYSSLCIFIDNIPVSKKKGAFTAAIKSEIKGKQPKQTYKIYFPPSTSNPLLQVVDYINWAIFRKWEQKDMRSYDVIKKFLGKPELDVFKKGLVEYYHFK